MRYQEKGFVKIILILLLLLLIPVIVGAFLLGLKAFTMTRHLQSLPKPFSTGQPAYINRPNPADDKLTQLRTEGRNAKRQSDIDGIAKALESHFGEETPNLYPVLRGDWFAVGSIPADPSGEKYDIPTSPVANFNICVNLENASPSQYCVKSKH